jgi:hypothetical protein
MTFVMKEDVAPNPGHICLFGPATITPQTEQLAHSIEKFRLARGNGLWYWGRHVFPLPDFFPRQQPK